MLSPIQLWRMFQIGFFNVVSEIVTPAAEAAERDISCYTGSPPNLSVVGVDGMVMF